MDEEGCDQLDMQTNSEGKHERGHKLEASIRIVFGGVNSLGAVNNEDIIQQQFQAIAFIPEEFVK